MASVSNSTTATAAKRKPRKNARRRARDVRKQQQQAEFEKSFQEYTLPEKYDEFRQVPTPTITADDIDVKATKKIALPSITSMSMSLTPEMLDTEAKLAISDVIPDKLKNYIESLEKKSTNFISYLTFGATEKFIQETLNFTGARSLIMKYMIKNGLTYIPWPPGFSCNDEGYRNWEAYKDPTFFLRLLPPRTADKPLTDVSEKDLAEAIFLRKDGGKPEETNKSCLLFPWFAQWFVEQFFKTGKRWDPDIAQKDNECGRNWSGNDIDLSTVYGDTRTREAVLRTHKGGKLRTQTINGEDYPLYWKDLNEQEKKDCPMAFPQDPPLTDEQKGKFFVVGHPRQSLHPGVQLWATLFLREHNRICDELAKTYSKDATWDDERYFASARLILVAILLRMTVEDYIQHINPVKLFQFQFKPELAQDLDLWQYSNRIGFEFNLLYRWHALIPNDVIDLKGNKTPFAKTFYETDYLTSRGTADVIRAARKQPANYFGVHCTPQDLLFLDEVSIRHARIQKLDTYNNYRKYFGLSKKTKFEDITKDPDAVAFLKKTYKTVDDVEYYVGIMAEDKTRGVFPDLLTVMVEAHALKGIFGNPLCSPRYWKPETFDPKKVGWDIIHSTHLPQFVARNVKGLKESEVALEVPN